MASKSRRNKVKFKWTKELIFLICGLLAIGVATIILAIPSKAETRLDYYNTSITEYNTANSKSFNTLGKNHVFDEIDYNGLESLVNSKKEDYTYVFYGSFTKEAFVENLSVINSKAETYKIDKVYLMFANWVEEQDTEAPKFKTEKKEIEAKFTTDNVDVEKFDITEYPSLLVFHDGKIVFNSQTYSESTEYNWNAYIIQAFTMQNKLDKQ